MVTGRGELLERIRMEYLEMPDLCLRRWQAKRLWNLEPTLCDDLLAVLVGEGFLVKTREGLFLRRHDERAPRSLTA
jgi:hypothetical protein